MAMVNAGLQLPIQAEL